ncbi:MAG TPA: peroxiredoxin [Pseudonocardia sp.]|jgi:peroxiredoxin Q/BCP
MKTLDLVSDFELQDETGTPRTLYTLLAAGPVVLFFYPLASSPGCTREACHFRDIAGEFAELGAQPIGISPDSVSKQQTFAEANSLGYPLLSDEGGAVAKAWGVWRRLSPMHTKRQTFVIGEDHRIIAVVTGEIRFDRHADEALRILRERRAADQTA